MRGRPFGTGIDDSERLRKLVAKLKTNPQLPVTTAIRDLGITNRSHVRRIRDKYHALTRPSTNRRLMKAEREVEAFLKGPSP